MKKSSIFLGLAGILLMWGCSQQPKLANANAQNNAATTTQQTSTQPTNNQNSQNATVNTANASVQEQSIPANATAAQQKFAKKLASIVIYFDFDKYNIRKDQWPKVVELAKLIKNHKGNYTIRIEGNCDEWGTEEYNYALGLKRANTVRKALIDLGVNPKKLTVISYGELNPVCTAHAKWCWRLNRRDNFTYLP